METKTNLTIAVLLATYNRKDYTLWCLKRLFDQKVSSGVQFDVFITDDASVDGTAAAVQTAFPKVHVFNGSGSLFWAGGMRNSWTEALKTKPDYYLLLNDDTLLDGLAVARLLQYYQQSDDAQPAICVGSTKDNDSPQITYGGHRLNHKNKAQYHNVYSDQEYLECDMANANIMLVHPAVVDQIGILSAGYTHSIADFDYCLRAKQAGFKVVVMPGVLGYCTDDHGQNWKSGKVGLRDRIKYLKSPKGLAYKEYLQFIKRHFPFYLPAAFTKLWLKTFFPVLWDRYK